MKKLLFFSFLFLCLANCKDNDDIDLTALDCDEIACTEIYVTLLVYLKDASGLAISLDRFEVIDKDSSKNITIPLSDSGFQHAQQFGYYPLYDDSFLTKNVNTKRSLVFKGFINDEKVVEAEYVIANDCCHVRMVSGDTDITIN
ncbi:hypothetical protein [Maribacter sp. 2308TA10-17]|uniref:hypothetical protein n=1 Tax=Maribacter sp. 2308TA10-17 TaxID=3386276 RepID=UPI0039BC59B3